MKQRLHLENNSHEQSKSNDKPAVTIINIYQARDIVARFEQKLALMYKKLQLQHHPGSNTSEKESLNRINNVLKEMNQDEYKKWLQSLQYAQRLWKEKTSTDTLKPCNINGVYSPPVNTFINGQNININVNLNTQKKLLNAYRERDWHNPIFSHELFLQTALALFRSGKLEPAEFETLLIIKYAKTPYKHHKLNKQYNLDSISILNETGQFTSEFSCLLESNFLDGYMYQTVKPVHLENLRFLLKAFFEKYPSENVLFRIYIQQREMDSLAKELSKIKLSATLYQDIKRIPFYLINVTDTYHKIIPSYIVEEALQLSFFKLEDVIPLRSIAGDLTLFDIERCVNVGLRPGAVSFDGVPRNKDIHGHDVSDSSRREHDRYHAQLMSRQGFSIQQALLHIKNLSRSQILQYCDSLKQIPYHLLFSRPTWKLVDAENNYFNGPDCQKLASLCTTPRGTARVLCEAIDYNQKILFSYNEITDLGIVVFIDMVMNLKLWLDFNIDPEGLTGKYKKHYEIAKSLSSYFKEDSRYNIIIFRICLTFGNEHFHEALKIFSNENDGKTKINEELLNLLKFKRDNSNSFIGLKNNKYKYLGLENGFIFTLLQSLGLFNENTEVKTFYFHAYKELMINILLLYIYFYKTPSIVNEICVPVCSLLKRAIAELGCIDIENDLFPYQVKLEKFVNHHEDLMGNSLTGNQLKVAKEIYQKFTDFINKNAALADKITPEPELDNEESINSHYVLDIKYLQIAIKEANPQACLETINSLINYEIEIDPECCQALFNLAIKNNCYPFISFLSKKIDNKIFEHELRLAIIGNNCELVSIILKDAHIDINAIDEKNNTFLHLSANSCIEIVEDLLKMENIKVNAVNQDGNTPLHLAVYGNSKTTDTFLGDVRIDINAANHKNHTPLHLAAESGNISAVQSLLSFNNVNINAKDKNNSSAFDIAISKRNKAIVQTLYKEKLNHIDEIYKQNKALKKDNSDSMFPFFDTTNDIVWPFHVDKPRLTAWFKVNKMLKAMNDNQSKIDLIDAAIRLDVFKEHRSGFFNSRDTFTVTKLKELKKQLQESLVNDYVLNEPYDVCNPPIK